MLRKDYRLSSAVNYLRAALHRYDELRTLYYEDEERNIPKDEVIEDARTFLAGLPRLDIEENHIGPRARLVQKRQGMPQ